MHMTWTGERYVPYLRGQISYEHLHRYALARTLAQDKDVLDIASGEGYGSALLATVAKSVIGVDIDDASVRFAGSRYVAMNLSFRTGSAAQIPLGDASVDVIVSFETIEHLTEHERMFAEFKRVLRPKGRLIISSPNKLIYSDARGQSNPYHVRELYFHELRDALNDSFKEVRLFGHRIFGGSAVHPLSGTAPATSWLAPASSPETGISALPDPEYFLAVCSKLAGDTLPDLSSIYLDPLDDLLDDVRSGGLSSSAHVLFSNATSPRSLPTATLSLPASTHTDDRNRYERDIDIEDETDLRKVKRHCEELRLTLHSAREEIRTLLETAQEKDAKTHVLHQTLAETVAFIDELSIRALERDPLQALAARDAAHVAAHSAQNDAHAAELATQTAELARLTAEHAQLTSENALLTSELASHQTLVESLVSDRDRLGAMLAQSREESDSLRLAAEALVSSKSWKMTQPIRRVAAALALGGKE